MILEKKVNVIYSGTNIPLLKSKGYLGFKYGDTIEVNVEDLSLGSSVKITAICKICDSYNKINYSKYNLNFSRQGYYGCKKCSQIKLEVSSMSKYGTKRPSQSNIVKKKQEETNILKYGTKSVLQFEETRIKTIKTNILKYGCVYPFSNSLIREKSRNTMIDRYGCEYTAQNVELYKKINKVKRKLHYSGLYYESSYELNFIDFCIENNIKIKRGPSIKYYFDNKNRTYHSDFLIEDYNLIIEIKSKYFYNKFLEKNIAKMEICKNIGYNFKFLIDCDYDDFKEYLTLFLF